MTKYSNPIQSDSIVCRHPRGYSKYGNHDGILGINGLQHENDKTYQAYNLFTYLLLLLELEGTRYTKRRNKFSKKVKNSNR